MSDHKSFLKWAGGKIKLLPKLREIGIEEGNRFIEPFVGSGVVSLNMPHNEIIIGDSNRALINLWQELFTKKEIVLNAARTYFVERYNEEGMYYDVREEFNRNQLGWNAACQFLYLNRHCFNGLCRFNSKGEFNVPYGRYKTVYFPEAELKHAAEVAKRMTIKHEGFYDIFSLVKKGDMVYCDPPYLPAQKNGFVKYDRGGFTLQSHKVLAQMAKEASEEGATVIISNNDTDDAEVLYRDADETYFIDVQKNISCKGDGRKKQREVIAVYRP